MRGSPRAPALERREAGTIPGHWRTLIALLVIPLLSLACNGKDVRPLTSSELANLIPASEEVSALLPNAQLISAGPLTNEQLIQRAAGQFRKDPRADVEKYGRVTGYSANFGEPAGFEVHAFKSASGASQALKDYLTDERKLFEAAPTVFQSVEAFAVTDVGDEAQGLRLQPQVANPSTIIFVRIANMLARVQATDADKEVAGKAALDLATKVAVKADAMLQKLR